MYICPASGQNLAFEGFTEGTPKKLGPWKILAGKVLVDKFSVSTSGPAV